MSQNKYHQFGQRSGAGTYKNTEFGENAEIYGSPNISNSKILHGQIFDSPRIHNSVVSGLSVISGKATIKSSFVGGRARVIGNPYVIHSFIMDDAVISDEVLVQNCEVTDKVKITDNARVEHSRISGDVVITGNGKLIGRPHDILDISGYNYIHRGLWMKPPKVRVASSGFVLTECTEGHVDIGCICNKPDKFLRAGYRYMEILGFTKEQTDEIKDLLSDLLKEV